jgi:3-hydroxyisobutyrate dehydrogenase/glyoxylate/succinic semialdehyde reductase
MKLAFVGLGIMGSRMAVHLQRAGHELTVHTRTRAHAEALLGAGAHWADSPQAAAHGAECVVTMLSEPAGVRAMAEGPQGFLGGMNAGALWVDCSTVNPSFAREMAGACDRLGLRYVDAPVAGSKGPAEKGELAFLVGGSERDVALARPLLELMGSTLTHVGPAGSGSAMKMVSNLLLGVGAIAFVEALVLGESLGIAKQTLLDSLLGGRMTPGFLAGKKDNFANDRYEPHFPLQWLHKDLQLVTATAYETGVALPATHATKEIFAMARRAGLGEQDYTAVYRALARKAGV